MTRSTINLPKTCSEEEELRIFSELVVAAILGPPETTSIVNDALKRWRPEIVRPNGKRVLR